MARRLTAFVHVHRKDKDGNVTSTEVFGPNDDVPKWAAQQLSDAHWTDEPAGRAAADTPDQPAATPE